MAQFITTSGIAYQLEDLIKTANQQIVLIAPYLKVHKLIMQRLKDSSARNIPITIIYRKDPTISKAEMERLENELTKLKELSTVELYEIENLHAKCFMNEQKMIIGSMNLHDYSEKNNREMGILISKVADRQIYNEAFTEFESIKNASKPIRVLQKKVTESKKPVLPKTKALLKIDEKKEGYCIRCAAPRNFNVFSPLCDDCYNVWAQFNEGDFPEKFCHYSGEASNGQTSYNKPVLAKNWKKAKAQFNLQ